MSTNTHARESGRIRVLYSFPHKLGAGRICYTAWQQVNGLAQAGADLTVFPGVLHKHTAPDVKVRTTLSRGKLRIPYKLLGTMRACDWHDRIVARRLPALAGAVDIIHAWPLGAIHTLKAAARLGIPTVLERPNAHTRFAFEVVQQECERLGVALPPDHEHAYNEEVLRREEQEYRLATRLLCPSDFVVRTFVDRGFSRDCLVRHQYGFDENVYYPTATSANADAGLTMLFVGVCAVRKGLHYALEAWLKSTACRNGKFLIAGEFLPAYAEKLASMLAHDSVSVLGHRNDVPELMRRSDILVLPSIEEGYGLVIAEAIGSGCVPLASDACTEVCGHADAGIPHHVGDVETLARQITRLNEDRSLLSHLRAACLRLAPELTWAAAGRQLLAVYQDVISAYAASTPTRARTAAGAAL